MFKINNFIFKINNPYSIPLPINMNKFICHDINYNYIYDIEVNDIIDVYEDSFHYTKDNIKIIINHSLEKRYLYIPGYPSPYAVCEEISDNHSIIKIQKDFVDSMSIDTMFVSLLSLERRMYQYNQYILHSSFVLYNDTAILFTAPSGTGKSTQADLWHKYRNTRTINGDRSLLVKKDNCYYACGWPICGSSEICFNEMYPISSIVVLSQGKENKIEEMDTKDKFKKLLSEITINYHNTDFVMKAMDFIEDITSHIPIYHLTCTISEDAVKCLENKIKKAIT